MLYTTFYLSVNFSLIHVKSHFINNIIDKVFSFSQFFVYAFTQFLINFRIKILHAKVIHLHLNTGDTKTICNRCVNIHCLTSLLNLLRCSLILQSSQVMKSICELDDNNSNILCHSQEHFTKILCLNLNLILRKIELSQLCNTVHKKRNLRRKLSGKILLCVLCIFNNIMKKTSCYCLLIHFQPCKNYCYTKRVNDIRFPGLTSLILMCIVCNMISFLNHREIIRWMIKFYLLNQDIVYLIWRSKILRSCEHTRLSTVIYYFKNRSSFCTQRLSLLVQKFCSNI